ncbi:MAG: phosphoadenosine phosphosulfate reductase [Pseudonocardiales bacterium]|jgi:phosphoadenosine phosphosulfate reductase|nr:phosphoadenosine phosphosulfate reductase [Pseudonocardiales bacterium]MDT4921068.1 phosphoadenosine phosphosulfate reductase [Pseudonocardiales bacterium]MDT4942367.1 phosphoadenosine phosphosulfate reductase [Pseudonocardiales bacterium]
MSVAAGKADYYQSVALEAGREFADAPAEKVIDWAVQEFGDGFCIAASMADAVLIDLASRVAPDIPVVFLDTGYHFAETLETRDRVAKRYPVKLHTILPKQTVAEQDATFGPKLHDRDPDACCSLRKVEPLARALSPYHAWASGIRRDEAASRRNIGVVEWDRKRAMVKVNPLATWTQEQIDEYVIANDVEINPLAYDGYPSIGCGPCTRRVLPGEDPRSGRWANTRKTECGLHPE